MKKILEKTGVSRKEFKNLKFPSLPFCEFGLKSGNSTKFNESWHYQNSSTGVNLNIYWYDNNTVSVSVYDPRIKNRFEVNKSILSMSNKFNNEILKLYCHQFLC